MTHEEMKELLMGEIENELNMMLGQMKPGEPMPLTEIEDVALEVRRRIGERMVNRMVQLKEQEAEAVRESPVSEANRLRLQRKGKKNAR